MNRHVGRTKSDKHAILIEFQTANRIVVEYGGASGGASKYRGKGIQMAGVNDNYGNPIFFQVVSDAKGKEVVRPTLAKNTSRYFFLSTNGFDRIWNAVK